MSVPEPNRKEFISEKNIDAHFSVNNDSEDKSNTIIKNRRKALQEAFRRSLTSVNDYYCITGEELVKSYTPFIPLLKERIFQRHGSTKILTNIEREVIHAAKELSNAGAEISHIDGLTLRRCVVYDNNAAYFSIIEPLITREATDSVNQTEGEDFWIASTEPSVIYSAKKRFISDWACALPLEERIVYYYTVLENICNNIS